MRAVIIDAPGIIRVDNVPDPTPRPDEVLVRVGACGICGTDLHIIDGDSPLARYPIIPGHEFAGEVVALGSDVAQRNGKEGANITVGSRIAVEPNLYCGYCDFCRTVHENLCLNYAAIGVTTNGAIAQYVTVPIAKAYALPDNISLREAALIEPVSCAVHGMHSLNPRSGDTFLIVGAGTMGLLLLQLAVRGGASRVAMVDVNAQRLARAELLGATRTYSDMKLAVYCGKIRRIMLHKPEIAGQSTCFASITCDASSRLAIDLGVGVCYLESFSTPNGSVKHHMARNRSALKQFVAVLECFSRERAKKHSTIDLYLRQTTHCQDMLRKSYSLPIYAAGRFIACFLWTGFSARDTARICYAKTDRIWIKSHDIKQALKDEPLGFNCVIDATGVAPVIENAFMAVKRGGKFLIFGVASPEAHISLSPFRIYNDEITIVGSMAVLFSFQAALDLISSGVINTQAMLTTALPLQDFREALDMVRYGKGVKTQILPNA